MSSFLAVALELFPVLVCERAVLARTHLGGCMYTLAVKVQQLLALEVLPTISALNFMLGSIICMIFLMLLQVMGILVLLPTGVAMKLGDSQVGNGMIYVL